MNGDSGRQETGPGNNGSGTPRRTQKKPDDAPWFLWPAIILCAVFQIWPLFAVLLCYSLFRDDRKRRAAKSGNEAPDPVERAVRAAGARVRKKEKDAERDARKDMKETRSRTGTALRVAGIVCAAIGGIALLSCLADMFGGWGADAEDLFAGLGFLASGAVMWGRGQYLGTLSRRSRRYILAIGGAEAMPIAEIAKRVNRAPEKAARELQRLIDRGCLGEDAYLDRARGYFLRFGASPEETPEEAAPPPPPPAETAEGYSGILRAIRAANDRIADETVSARIDRLEQISGLIFREVEEHPEKKERIRSFFDYYVPTTQKLLDAYADFEAAGVEGENLREAKARIEQIMDGVVEGFEYHLDQLYSGDAMDVVSDVKVMEAMLDRDLASAERDFGPPPGETAPPAREEKNAPGEGTALEA